MLLLRHLGLGLLGFSLLGVSCDGSVVADPGGHGGAGGDTSTGAGGLLPLQCLLPQAVGPCDAAVPAYWHHPKTGVCEPFTYGGCDGNENRFESFEDCQQTCQGGSPDMDACTAPGDCGVATPVCCGVCDPADDRTFVGINRDFVDSYHSARGCEIVPCVPCPPVDEGERTSQYYAATCESGRCVVLDVRESPITQCTEDADCILRDGVACCQGCDGTGIVAVNRNADLEHLVCGDRDQGCPPCEPQFPPNMAPICSEGRCRWVILEGE
jgi:hypothetical protein